MPERQYCCGPFKESQVSSTPGLLQVVEEPVRCLHGWRQSFCSPERWHITESYVSPDLPGDIDLLIRPNQHTTFVVEIKSHRGDPRAEGDKDWGDVIADVKRQGRLFHKPHLVVWQPIANRQEIISHEGVDFVPGEAGVLLKYIEQRLVQKVAKGD